MLYGGVEQRLKYPILENKGRCKQIQNIFQIVKSDRNNYVLFLAYLLWNWRDISNEHYLWGSKQSMGNILIQLYRESIRDIKMYIQVQWNNILVPKIHGGHSSCITLFHYTGLKFRAGLQLEVLYIICNIKKKFS